MRIKLIFIKQILCKFEKKMIDDMWNNYRLNKFDKFYDIY